MAEKEPWQMTRAAYLEQQKSPGGWFDPTELSFGTRDRRMLSATAYHEGEVAGAIREGKLVPPEVLADYPDLVPLSKG